MQRPFGFSAIPTPGVRLYGGGTSDSYVSGDLNHPDAPTYCPNLGGEITADPTEFAYGELDCQVKWHIEEWEGGEMWTATAMDISNYQDILVKYYLEASVEDTSIPTSGISELPYGFVPYTLYELPDDAEFFNVSSGGRLEDPFLPYICCKGINADLASQEQGLRTTTNCADGCFMEQMLMVLYSTDETATPDIDAQYITNVGLRLANIRKWRIAEVVPRKVLRRAKEGTVRVLDFSRQRDIAQKNYLKLWFRFQTDDVNDEVRMKQVRVYGILKPTPTPTPQ